MDNDNQVERNLINPSSRDVAMAPANGYVVLRVFFDNPGFNSAHCHIEPHSINGMFAVFMVGTVEQIRQQQLYQNHQFDPIQNNYCI